jgi:Carboxypeptidase regulatory-like domain
MLATKRSSFMLRRSRLLLVIASCAAAIGLPLLVPAAPAGAVTSAGAASSAGAVTSASAASSASHDSPAKTGPSAAQAGALRLAALRQRELAARQHSGSITGLVAGANGLPLAGACVTAIGSGRSVTTGASPAGRFDITGLAAGSYVLEYRDCAAPARYLTRWSGGTAWQRTAAPVRVGADQVSHVPAMTLKPLNPAAMLPDPASWQRALARGDRQLSPAAAAKTGTISGVVTGKGRRLRGICVDVLQTATGPVPPAVGASGYAALTRKNGTYAIHGLTPGSYNVVFEPFSLCSDPANWLEQNYRGHNQVFLIPGNTVKVTAGKTTKGIDANLVKGGQISGTVKTRSGQALPGACVQTSTQIDGNFLGSGFEAGKGGSYVLHGLFPATYTLSFSSGCGVKGNYAPAFPAPVKIRHADHRTLNVRLGPGAVLAGTVRLGSSTGAPLQGICVAASNESGTIFSETSTGANGSYRLDSLGTGAYSVLFFPGCDNNGNYISATLSAHATDGKVTSLDAILQQGAEILGTVTNSAGAGLGGICIELAGPINSSPNVPGATTGDGSYLIDQMSAGTYELGFSTGCGSNGNYAPYYYDDEGDPNLATPINVAAASAQTIDVKMATGGQLTGTVTDSHGKKLRGVCVVVVDSPDSDFAFFTGPYTTNRNGRFTASGLEPGLYYVEFGCGSARYGNEWFDAGSSGGADLVSVAAGQTSGMNAVLRPGGSISGVVTGKSGKPLSGICVQDLSTQQSSYVQELIELPLTNSRGRYEIQGLAPGRYDVEFFPCGSDSRYAAQWYRNTAVQTSATSVRVGAGAVTTGIDARLTAGGTVYGRVVNGSGKPLGNVCVDAYNPNKGLFGGATTGKTGKYRMVGVATGSYTVEFSPCNSAVNLVTVTKHTKVVAPRTSGGVDATLVPGGSVSGVVTTAGPTPVQVTNECVEVISANPDNPGGLGFSGSNGMGGSYLATGIAPGKYTVYFGDPWCSAGPPNLSGQWYDNAVTQAAATSITVTAGQTTTGIDAALQTTGEITGTVSGPAGALVSGACVTAYPTAPGSFPIVAVTRSGGYSLADLQPGRYRIKFSAGCGATGYHTQWWHGANSASKATVITVSAAGVVSGISATLSK